MAVITKEKFKEIVANDPKKRSPKEIFNYLQSKGATFDGLDTAKSSTSTPAPTTAPVTPDPARVSSPDGGFAFGNMNAQPAVKPDPLQSVHGSTPERAQQGRDGLASIGEDLKNTNVLGVPLGGVLDTGKSLVRDIGRGAEGMSNLFDATAGALGRGAAKMLGADENKVDTQHENIQQGVHDIQSSVEDNTKASTVPQWIADFGAKALEMALVAPGAGAAGSLAKGARTGVTGALLKAGAEGATYGAEGALTAKEGDRTLTGAISGALGAGGSLASDAYQGLRGAAYKLQGLDDKMKSTLNPELFSSPEAKVVQNAVKNPEQAKLLSQVIDDVENYNVTPRSDTALAKLGKVIDGAYAKLKTISDTTSSEQKTALREVASNKIPTTAWDDVKTGVTDFLKEQNIVQKVNKAGKTVFTTEKGRAPLVPLAEVKKIFNVLNTAQKKGNVGYAADTVKKLQELVQPKGLVHPFSDTGEALTARASALLRKAREAGSTGSKYSETIAKNAKLQQAIKFVEKIGGNEGQRGELVAKRLFAENNGDANEFAKILKEATGVDIYPHAAYVKWATEMFGNPESRSLLAQTIENPSKLGILKGSAKWIMSKLTNPKSEALRIAAGDTFGGTLAKVVKNAPPAIVTAAETLVNYLDSDSTD